MPVNPMAVGAIAAGSVSVYAGYKGISIPAAFQAIVQGKSPATVPQTQGIIDPPVSIPSAGSAGVGPGSATGQAIANDALRYQGAGYVYGGRADRPGNWDCSSFVFYVLAHDLHMTVLGHKWGEGGVPPHGHGPAAAEYRGAGAAASGIQAGDLLVWDSHIGIAISATQMVAARSQSSGTGVTNIADTARYHGAQPTVRRVGT